MRLDASGKVVSSQGQNAGGNTLECLFGIGSNASKEPDYKGWELKNIDAQNDRLTLVTPEPQGGLYGKLGVVEFVRRFGYRDSTNRNRKNFASPHFTSTLNKKTKLTLGIDGYSRREKKITNNDGGIVLKTSRGSIAAKWNFTDLMYDWNRKHARVVIVPSSSTQIDGRRYNYLQNVAVAEQSDFLRFLRALSERRVYFDPGTNVLFVRLRAKAHARSQFRIKLGDVSTLYRVFRWVNICEPIRIRTARRRG
jgi:hypothetical protein